MWITILSKITNIWNTGKYWVIGATAGLLYLLGYMKGKHNEELKTKGAVLDDVKKAKKVRDTLNDAGRINRLHSKYKR